MWWPAIGAVAVGVIGYFAPDTLGVGYDNITRAISADTSSSVALKGLAVLWVLKFVSWAIALGSGTSGGTLAPLFTIGGALGALPGAGAAHLFPGHNIDPRVAALVGMAALFAGASRALLTSVVFAFETTLQPLGLLPLLGGCSAAYFVSCAMMQDTIMTAKISRHGVRVPAEFLADFLDHVRVRDIAQKNLVCLRTGQTLGEVHRWIASGAPGSAHQGFPVLDDDGRLVGLVTRRDLLGDGRRMTVPWARSSVARRSRSSPTARSARRLTRWSPWGWGALRSSKGTAPIGWSASSPAATCSPPTGPGSATSAGPSEAFACRYPGSRGASLARTGRRHRANRAKWNTADSDIRTAF
ncbi:MAG TPA: chloride channel protein [Tepidisphaeraceae bacterium]|jgi:hypothetical protein